MPSLKIAEVTTKKIGDICPAGGTEEHGEYHLEIDGGAGYQIVYGGPRCIKAGRARVKEVVHTPYDTERIAETQLYVQQGKNIAEKHLDDMEERGRFLFALDETGEALNEATKIGDNQLGQYLGTFTFPTIPIWHRNGVVKFEYRLNPIIGPDQKYVDQGLISYELISNHDKSLYSLLVTHFQTNPLGHARTKYSVRTKEMLIKESGGETKFKTGESILGNGMPAERYYHELHATLMQTARRKAELAAKST